MERERRRIRVTGTVQGVGFRPFVYRCALELGLAGTVANDSGGVVIEAEGHPARLDELCRRLRDDAPPLARVASVEAARVPTVPGEAGFGIAASHGDDAPDVPVSVDVGPCDECLAEVADPAARRYRYPFANCTNCGPRYTITHRIPYDRPSTTMAAFAMCSGCRAEYDDPADRRFHAQPIACPACGPQLTLADAAGIAVATGDEALVRAAERLRAGAVLAVKGVGGYHLAVDATDEAAVATLRRRKARDDKPFALLVADVAAARALVVLDASAEETLVSPRRPIVLAPRRAAGTVARGVAPGLPELGVMLPPSPLHHLLARDVGRPLVLTSGNLSDDPIAHDDADARARLAPLVDGFLLHDRPIAVRCDDSVVRAAVAGGVQTVRRSRGYAPEPLPLPVAARRPLLAVGAELKNTVAVAKGAWVVASHHIGDLEHYATYTAFLHAVSHLCHLHGVAPEVVAHDLHPEYLSTKFALDLDAELVGVQHHHAHIAACIAEHGVATAVLGVAFDGLGYGTDGTLWGGEFLVADLRAFERVGRLRPVPLPGGAAAIREPWRMAVAWVREALGEDALARVGPSLDERWQAVASLAAAGVAPLTSSVGRLFDTAAALLGVRQRVTYEGQAAVELEALARTVAPGDAPRYPVVWSDGVLDPSPLLAALLEERDRGVERAVLAAGFHGSLAAATVRAARELAADAGLDTVALSGGVFQNGRLSGLVVEGLRDAGLRVLVHRRLPPNDGAISVGQAAVAAARSVT